MRLRRDPVGSARVGSRKARGRSGWGVAFLLVLALAAGGLAACGGSGGTASTSDEGAAATTPAAAEPDYATLLTLEDVRAITGHKDATPMPKADWGMRAGSSKYFALYQADDWREAVWFRVSHKGTFEEARRASDTPAVTIPGLGDDAFWWEYSGMDRGIAFIVGDTTYVVSTRYAWDKPELTDDQLLEVARTVAGRL